MPLIDWLAALLTITCWGLNFFITKLGLTEIPPFLFGFLRFFLVCFPVIFFVKRPQAPLGQVLFYGLFINFLQFSFMFTSIYLGLPAGLTSLLMQVQAFFTILISALYFKEAISKISMLAFVLTISGIVMIVLANQVHSNIPLLGLLFCLLAALCWALGNISIKVMRNVNMLSLVVWGSLMAWPAFAVTSYVLEGPELIRSSIEHMSHHGVLAILWNVVLSTLVGYVIWGKLLATRPVALIAPLTLLVPIIGIFSNWWVFDEQLSPLQWTGVTVIMLALVVNVLGSKCLRWLGISWPGRKA